MAALVAVLLSGCTATSAPDPNVTPTAAIKQPCLGEVGFPGLPVWELNAELPVANVGPEYIQYELAVERGPGTCADTDTSHLSYGCAVQTGPAEQTIDEMLGRSPDDLTASEFANGATAAITETVTGRTSTGGAFQYRMTAWHFPTEAETEASHIIAIVAGCDGAVVDRMADLALVFDGDEPHVLAYREGSEVFLVESIRNLAPDGSVASIDDTESGLLPVAAVQTIREWWTAHASDYFDSPRTPAKNTPSSSNAPVK